MAGNAARHFEPTPVREASTPLAALMASPGAESILYGRVIPKPEIVWFW